MRIVEAFGVVIPARRDGENAISTARAVVAAADTSEAALTVIVADDGDNGELGAVLGADPSIIVVTTEEHGPGFARSAGAAAFARWVAASGFAPERSWLVSLDADVALGPDFVRTWQREIEQSDGDVLCAPARFGALGGELGLDPDVDAASAWLWGDTALYEQFVGVVNSGGCNHAVSLATCLANDRYLQPTAEFSGKREIVAGDDWDFGLRARMRGFSIERVASPVVVTSTRRLAADPVGFLAGRSYERPFEPVRGAAVATVWPPDEAWDAIAAHGRARLVAHFLLKPILAGLEPHGALDWFLGETLAKQLAEIAGRAPRWDSDWNSFRTAMISLLFEDDVFTCCGRIAQRFSGAPTQ